MAAGNYDDVLQQLRSAGLVVDRLEVGTARTVRCLTEDGGREKRGWYRLHELQTDGGAVLIVGSFGIWRGDNNNAQKVVLGKTSPLTAEQRDALRRRLAEDRKALERERAQQAEAAARRADAAWGKYLVDGESDYLARKGVRGHGLRYTKRGAAVVPLLDAGGRVHGLQFLRTQQQADEAKRPVKEFWPVGVAKKGHFHLVGSPDWIVLVAEGYATAATLHEATSYPVAVAFDAGNLGPVARALRFRYKQARILICADDDSLGKCLGCKARVALADHPTDCPACGEPHAISNTGVGSASSAALEVNGAWLAPRFADDAARRAAFVDKGRKPTDFNDLHAAEGLHVVRTQVEARLTELDWRAANPRASSSTTGERGDGRLRPLLYLHELLPRYALVYGSNGAVFDRGEHCLLPLTDMRNACIRSDLHKAWMEHPEREIVRMQEVGFDPAGDDPTITCNLWSGWPTEPKAGACDRLLDLLRYMCSGDRTPEPLFDWVLKWIAYPIQYPGAKMKSTIVVHGPQGAGKNMFFEAIMAIYGQYGRMLDQDALEDRFNDWASRKLFLIADEVIARGNIFHLKNKLKTLVTGTRIRINPKNMAAYEEANHVNLVFLSNEAQPVVLEEDDRRHCVFWTPPKREHAYYAAIKAEIAAGGIAALHDYLLHLPLGDFDEGTLPPTTDAKTELISLAQDSALEFIDLLYSGDIRYLKPMPGLSTDWYEAYKIWSGRVGVKPAPMKRWLNAIARKRDLTSDKKRYLDGQSVRQQRLITFGLEPPEGESEQSWLGQELEKFATGFKDFRGAVQ
ncbi:DUF5906 domain-containing protein [Luteimonas notoginsengisoli]|uniref:DUF5906 domain-containing protein n=1 Tax=Luteimonas notoginsengisoli TaxID=1578200 RepID=A0ABV7UQ37_9GAMM